MSGTKVYVGGLKPDENERDVEDEFSRFGKLFKFWMARNPPGFAFVDYEDARDAEDACKKLDGHKGWRVEISRSRGPGPRGGGGDRGPPRGRGDMACYNCGELGHMARDCRTPRGGGGGGDRGGGDRGRGGGDRGRDFSPRRDRSRSPRRSRSPPRRGSPPPRRGSPPPRRDSPPPRRDSPPPRRSPSPRRGRGGSRSRSPAGRDRSRS